MLDVFERAAKHLPRATAVFVLVLISLVIVVLHREKLYEARALILFTLGREYVYVPEARQSDIKAPNPGDFQGVVNAEMLLLNSPEISRAALQSIGLDRVYPDLPMTDEGFVQGMLQFDAATSIELITGTYVVKVAVRHTDPVIAAELANAQATAFLERRRTMYAGLESSTLRAQLAAATAQAEDVESETAVLLDGADPLVVEAELENALARQMQLSSLISEASVIRAGLAERLAALDKRLGLDGERLTTEIALQEQDARLSYLQHAMEENGREIDRLSGLMPRLKLLKEIQQVQVEQIADLKMRLHDAEALASLPQEENVRIIETAVPPLRSVSMPRSVQLLIAGIVAGLVASGVLAISVLLDRRVITASGAAAELGVSVLGEIPTRSHRRARPVRTG